jgi:hypothetical protein
MIIVWRSSNENIIFNYRSRYILVCCCHVAGDFSKRWFSRIATNLFGNERHLITNSLLAASVHSTENQTCLTAAALLSFLLKPTAVQRFQRFDKLMGINEIQQLNLRDSRKDSSL